MWRLNRDINDYWDQWAQGVYYYIWAPGEAKTFVRAIDMDLDDLFYTEELSLIGQHRSDKNRCKIYKFKPGLSLEIIQRIVKKGGA